MSNSLHRKPVTLLACIVSLGCPLAARADDSMVWRAHSELQQAESGSPVEQKTHLKSALAILQHLPPVKQGNQTRGAAVRYIKTAIFELDHGDPDHKVSTLIRNAEDKVRKVED